MPDLVAQYGRRALAVIAVEDGVPLVYHDGCVRPAADVRIGAETLDRIVHAPKYIAASPGWWADYEYTTKERATTRNSYPLLAIRIHADGWGEGIVLDGNGIELAHDKHTGNHRFLGYRLGVVEPYDAHPGE